MSLNRNDISKILESLENWKNVPYVVEDDRVWISGSYAKSTLVAKRMTENLVYVEDIPCGLPYTDPDRGRFSGVAFNWYDPGELDEETFRERKYEIPDFDEQELVHPDE